jgi:hypothetical protein
MNTPQRPALDGRRFTGVVLERGKTAGDADRLIFDNGRFRSTACDRYDYGPNRLRVNGHANLHFDDPLLGDFAGAQLLVRVRAQRIFPNCPRYIHRLQCVEPSPYVPHADAVPPVPKWKSLDAFRDVLPAGDPARED